MDFWDMFSGGLLSWLDPKKAEKAVAGIKDTHDDPLDYVLDVMGVTEGTRKEYISIMDAMPVIGDVLSAMDRYKKNADYMKNTGTDWSQVKYPALLDNGANQFMTGVSSLTNFVSRNIEKLYEDKPKPEPKDKYVQFRFE